MLQRYLDSLTAKGGNYILNLSEFIFGGVIGKGGFGEVRKAVQISTQRYCASKQIFSSRIEGSKFKRYISEVETMLKCDNMFLVPLVGFTVEPPYTIITEYMPGGTLDKALKPNTKKEPLSPTQLTMIAIGIANGMMSLHQNNIIHRDLKSSNILLNANQLPAIIDFGISRVESSESGQTVGIGTPQYMAPELISSSTYDRKVDVYSFAMILYEMIELVKPFNDLSITDIFQKVVELGERPPFTEKTPKNLKKLIIQCWDQDPSKRPTFSQIFDEFASGKVFFPGTDAKKISKFLETIKADAQIRSEQRRMEEGNNDLTKLLVNFIEETSNTPVLTKEEENSGSDPPSAVLSDFSSPKFNRYITFYSETIEPSQFHKFYSPLSKNFARKNLPATAISTIAKAVNLLMKRNPNFAKLLLDANYFNDVPFDEKSVDDVITSFTILFAEFPELVNNSISKKVTELCLMRPEKMIVIISFFLKCEKRGDVNCIIKVLINIADFMINNSNAYLYISLLMNIATTTSEVSKNDADKIKKIFMNMMASPLPRTRATAYVAVSKLFDECPVDTKQVIADISNEIAKDAALTLIVRVAPNPPSSELYKALLGCIEVNPRPWIYFLRIAETKSGAFFLANNTEWTKVSEKLPTEVCRLFLVILGDKNGREVLMESACVLPVLESIMGMPGDDALDAVSIIIPMWAKNKQQVQKLSECGILNSFFSAALSGSFRAKRCALSVADSVGKMCFTNELVLVSRSLVSALQERELASIAIQATSTLSKYSQCNSQFAKEDLIEFFRNLLKYPAYESPAKYFLSNMEK